jgi:asparagine synthase (glutamine-hydrolysing)
MCGLAGFLTPGRIGAGAAVAARMSDALKHRGPDDADIWHDADAGIALAHRRLSILDLSPEGHQPMRSAGGRFVVAFNGEIYNFRRLRAELEPLGHRFRGHSDTEVLLAAVEQWGVREAVARAAGMFAFALWDRERRELTLGRDRLGEKPLYVARHGGSVLFASELKALRRHPAWRGEVDRDALALYLRFGYVPAPFAIYRGVEKLRPGTLLTVRAAAAAGDALAETTVEYWSPVAARAAALTDPLPDDDDACEDALDAVLREVVGEQMVADVPLGAFLSGGVDSSTVVGVMQARSTRPVRSFTIGFREAGFDEATHARAVARHLGTDHTELYVTPGEAQSVIPRLSTIYDEPFGDSSEIPTLLVAQLARRHVTVSLSGDGGDELFAGYGRYQDLERAWAKVARIPPALRPAVSRVTGRIPAAFVHRAATGAGVIHLAPRLGHRVERLSRMVAAPSVERLYEQLVSHWLSPHTLIEGARDLPTVFSAPPAAGASRVERAMLADLASYLPDDILVKVDRATMAVSLESRAPFLDHRVVDVAWRIPMRQKLRAGRGKDVLRRVLDRYVPRPLIERPKQGFGVPVGSWVRGPLRDWAETLLAPERLAADGLLRPAPIRRCWQEHLVGDQDWSDLLWSVLMLQAWREAQQD